MVLKPTVARGKFTLDANGPFGAAYQLAKGPREIVAIKAVGQGSAIAGHIYDTNNSLKLDTSQSIPFSSESSGSDNFTPCQPIPMNSGIYIVIEEGQGFNGSVTILYN